MNLEKDKYYLVENIYGHKKRLNWIISQIDKSDSLIEFGCGTGYMITLPLARLGFNIIGVDMDKDSITYGQRLMEEAGLNPAVLKAIDLGELDMVVDVVIASEVLEHLPDDVLSSTLALIRENLKPGGKLLVTVPNGYGWFELESFLWNKLYLGRLFEFSKIMSIIVKLKQLMLGKDIDVLYPSTLSSSPHIQRFTFQSIQNKLIEHKFDILEVQGSVLFCGQLSNLFLTGIKPIMKLNAWLGAQFPKTAASFYIAAIKR